MTVPYNCSIEKEGTTLPIHNKLVRDKIPEIIETSGKTAHTHILTDDEYISELDRKLFEEFTEYQANKSL